jgi:hypothetical protein
MTAEAALSLELQARGVLPLIADDAAHVAATEERDGFKRLCLLIRSTKIEVPELKRLLERAGLFPTRNFKERDRTW